MARRRKKINVQLQLCIGAVVLLFLYVIVNPSSFISIGFIVAALAILITSGIVYGNRLSKYVKTEQARDRRAKYARNIYVQHGVEFLTPREFENYTAGVLQKLGYTTTVTPQSNDKGIDIILKRDGVTTGVQVKKYTGNVDRPDIQKLVGAGLHRFDRMMCIAKSDFSIGAREFAKIYNIRLVSGAELEKLAETAFGKDHAHTALSKKLLGEYRS
jgi:HJR/Mrr/RecB family endonuclease